MRAQYRFLRLASLACLVSLGSCADLPTIPAGVCGNSIVEEGEDCDTVSTKGAESVCRPATVTGQCHYDCADTNKCPQGFGCGTDKICRAAKGTFELGAAKVSPGIGTSKL